MSEKNYERLRPLRDEMVCTRLITLPLKLSSAAERLEKPRKAAVAFQTALLIAFIVLIPLRLGNIRHLRLDQHLRWSNVQRRRPLFLVIPGAETKNKVRLEIEVPVPLQRLIELYIEQHRGQFAHADGPWLFPGACDVTRPKSDVTLRGQIEKAIARHVGIRFNPHLARHLAAYLWLREHPGDYGSVARMLGHKNPQTSYQIYCGFEQIETALRYNERILRTWNEKGR